MPLFRSQAVNIKSGTETAMLKSPCFSVAAFLLTAIIAGCNPARNEPSIVPHSEAQNAGYTDAVELKLKFRELADQLLTTMPNDALKGYVAMPTAFVNENDTTQTCPLGRLIAESLYYEFNQRGFPMREYGLSDNIAVGSGKNGLVLAPTRKISTKQKWAALIVGTYQPAKDATFINARLVRASDGLVLRTAELVLPNTPVVLSLLAGTATRGASAPVGAQSAPVRSPSSYPGRSYGYGDVGIPLVQVKK